MYEVQLTGVMFAFEGMLAGIVEMILQEVIVGASNYYITSRVVLNFYRVSII